MKSHGQGDVSAASQSISELASRNDGNANGAVGVRSGISMVLERQVWVETFQNMKL